MQNPDPVVASLHEWLGVFMQRSMRDFARYLRDSGLSMSQIGALFHIHRDESSGVSDLGDHLGVTSAAASQLLERLVQQDLILRSEDPADRRVKRLVLTEKGSRVVEESFRARQAWLDGLAETLSAAEKEQVVAALGILVEKAKQLDEPDASNSSLGI